MSDRRDGVSVARERHVLLVYISSHLASMRELGQCVGPPEHRKETKRVPGNAAFQSKVLERVGGGDRSAVEIGDWDMADDVTGANLTSGPSYA